MNDKSVKVSGGISLSGLTFIVFLVLKLCNVINWSWWWVTAPLWIPFVLVFIPESDLPNVLVWRQQDATRNAVQMLGQTYFSHKELDHKTTNMIQEMLFTQKGINFNDMPVEFKRGVCCTKQIYEKNGVLRRHWVIDKKPPIFSQRPDYILSAIYEDVN